MISKPGLRGSTGAVGPAETTHAAAADGTTNGRVTADADTAVGGAVLQLALDQVTDVVAVVQRSDTGAAEVVYANAAIHRSMGIAAPPTGIGQYERAIVAPLLARFCEQVSPLLRDSAASGTLSWQMPDGRTCEFGVETTPLAHPPERRGSRWLVVLREETEKRALNDRSAQSQRLEVLGLLAGSIAHDFNNLIHVVTGYSELALGSLSGRGAAAAHVQQAHEAAMRASGLARQLLAFSRRERLNTVRVDLRSILTGLRDVLTRLAGPRVALALELGDAPANVCADITQLEQIFLNLVVNARDAQPDGGRVTVMVDVLAAAEIPSGHFTRGRPDASRYVRARVVDAGPGIPDGVRSRVLEPFFTTKSQGTGLGLATVHRIVESNAGSMLLSSPPGEGLCVEVLLPESPPAVTA